MTPEEPRGPEVSPPAETPKEPAASGEGTGRTGDTTNVNIHTVPPERDFFGLAFGPISKLPENLHVFRALEHEQLLSALQKQRLLVLKSYRRRAAFAAGFDLTRDPAFDAKQRGLLTPTTEWSRDPRELDITSVVTDVRIERHVVLVPISQKCMFLDSVLNLELAKPDDISRRLRERHANMILAIDDRLWLDDEEHQQPAYSISHFSYLLTGHRIEDPEARLATRFDLAIRRIRDRLHREEIYALIHERLTRGVDAIEAYIRELEVGSQTPGRSARPAVPEATVSLVNSDSLAQRTALFVAAFLPDLGETEFDAFVVRLLGDQVKTSTVERRSVDDPGKPQVVTETREERWAAIYQRDTDDICRECRLTCVRREDGRAIVDFTEAHLRRDVRDQLRSRHSRFVRRQIQALQSSGLLFADLSETALDGLIRLFVERAREDPRLSGESWLSELANALRARMPGEPPEGSVPQQLGWLIAKALAEIQLRQFLYGRLSLLIREMLDREELRPMVSRIFTALIASNREEALLEVVLSLVRQLRFVRNFDPLEWMRRLLDQSSRTVRERTEESLLALAAHSGPKGSDLSATIRRWLPEPDRREEQFSASQIFALTFLYRLTELVDPDRPETEHLEPWANRLPFFSAMVTDADVDDARPGVQTLVRWAIDGRRAWKVPDQDLPPQEQDRRHAERLANLLERWARALAGARPATNESRGAVILDLLVRELGSVIGLNERLLMLRHWQGERDECRRQAVSTDDTTQRSRFLRRERTLAYLSARLVAVARDDDAKTRSAGERPFGDQEGAR
jgi:hypothetical protein